MSRSPTKKKTISAYLIIGIIVIIQLVIIGLLVYRQPHKNEAQQLELQKIANPTPLIEKPMKLRIPKLDIDTLVEHVGQNESGEMDVPSSFKTVGWYQLGVLPGERGNAVISGHYDTEDGKPAIFAQLKKLQQGDTITIEDEHNIKRSFVVYKTEVYPFDNAPLEEIFGATTSAQLNLITCEGEWDKKNKVYTDRLVVYTRLKE